MNNAQQQPTLFLFYSKNYCEHSKRCVDRLMKANMLSSMVLCNIDDAKLNIPPFITAVPTLYNVTERKLYMDTELGAWIDEKDPPAHCRGFRRSPGMRNARPSAVNTGAR